MAPSVGRTLARLVPVHVELLLVGWLVQLALGVAYWILPRAAGRRPGAWAAWGGAGCVAAGVAAAAGGGVAGLAPAVTIGRGLELAGAALFGGHAIVRLRCWRALDLRRREEVARERSERPRGRPPAPGS